MGRKIPSDRREERQPEQPLNRRDRLRLSRQVDQHGQPVLQKGTMDALNFARQHNPLALTA